MKNFFKRIISLVLAFVMVAGCATPVFADVGEDEAFAFKFPFMVNNQEKMIQLYKYGDELYIAHDSVPLLGEIEDHASYFERSDGAAIILEDYNTLYFDGVEYHPFEDIMIGLCLNTMYFEADQYANVEYDKVSLVPANNIFNVVYLGNRVMDDEAVCLYGYTPEHFKSTSAPKKNVFSQLKDGVTDFLFSDIKQANSDFEEYNCYRTAIWDIMLPVSVDLGWSSDYNSKWVDGANEQAYYYDVSENTVKLLSKSENLFTDDVKEKLDVKGQFFTESIKRAGAAVDILSMDDFLDIVEFAHNISNIDQSIGNAFSIIQKLYVSKNENLKKSIKDTVELYNGDQTPVDLYIDHVGMGALNTTMDALKGIAELPKALMLVADGYDLYNKQTYDSSLKKTYNLALGNLGVQQAAGDVFRQQRAGMQRLSDYKSRALRARDMHDVLMVYLLAGHNTWQAVGDMDEFKDDKAQVIYNIEKKYLSELQKLSYIDFEVYLTAENTKEKLLANAEPYVEPTPAPVATAKPVQAKENQFVISTADYNYIITYDNFVLAAHKDGDYITSVKIGFAEDLSSTIGKYYRTRVQAYTKYKDFSEYYDYQTSLWPMEKKEGLDFRAVAYGEPVTVDVGGGFKVNYFNVDTVTTKTDDDTIFTNRYCYLDLGTGECLVWDCNYFEKPMEALGMPIEELLQLLFIDIDVQSKSETVPDVKVAENQYLIDGDSADYLVTYDTDLFVLKDSNYGKGVGVTYTETIREELLYTGYDIDLGTDGKSFDEFYQMWKECYPLDYAEDDEIQTLSHESPVTVEIGGGLKATYFDFRCKSSKEPDGNIFINRYCYIDLGTGEYLHSQEFTVIQALEIMDISYAEYLQRLFADIAVMPQ